MNLFSAISLYALILGSYIALLWLISRRQPKELGLFAWFRHRWPLNRKESILVASIVISCAGWTLESAKQSDSLAMSGFVTDHDPTQSWLASMKTAGLVGGVSNTSVQRITDPRFHWARWCFQVTGKETDIGRLLAEYVQTVESQLFWKLARKRNFVSLPNRTFSVEYSGLLTRGVIFGSVGTHPDGTHQVIVEACEYPH